MSSIFKDMFSSNKVFVDRLSQRNEEGVDVIIPIMNTNELWESNLFSFYKEIPINNLIIGDAGSTDESIYIARKFPRVTVIEHKHLNTLGGALKDLISRVETDWFVYLHADVYLSAGWYDNMSIYKNDYDWFESPHKIVTCIEFWNRKDNDFHRPYSGAQMGKKTIFENVLPIIEDDYLYRNEDIIFMELVKNAGGKYGVASNKAFLYHQVMNKRGEKEPKFASIKIDRIQDKDWEIKTLDMQVKGIIKYLSPKNNSLISAVNIPLYMLYDLGALEWHSFKKWVKETNPLWLNYITYRRSYHRNFKQIIAPLLPKKLKNFLKKIIKVYTNENS
jgi:hypothetical protein